MVDKRLITKAKAKSRTPNIHVKPPAVEVKIDAPQVNMDSSQFANAINQLAASMNQLAQQQYALLEIIREHSNAMQNAAGNQPDIKVAAPVVKMAPRPRSYSVEVEDDNGEVTRMNIQANSPN